MEELLTFFGTYGLPLTLIAVLGVVILGILKYAGAFSKLEEKVRHILYFVISVGFSIIASAVYLLIISQFNISYLMTISLAIYALNQTFYSIFNVTSLDELCKTILEFVLNLLTKGFQKMSASRAARKAKRLEKKSEKNEEK